MLLTILPNIIFSLILVFGIFWFSKNVRTIARNIKLGRDIDIDDRKSERWWTMIKVALGQSKMVVRPVAGLLHVIVYAGFIIINIEVLEIIIDGIFGTHRVLAEPLGPLYDILIGGFEILAILVLVACVLFLIRRNLVRIKRFWSKEMTSWPRSDANYILIFEIGLMTAFLSMNGADLTLQERGDPHYIQAGAYPISSILLPLFEGWSAASLIMLERGMWWFHIIGILIFLNYVPYSKHFHIFLAFPNTYYSDLDAKGRFTNMESVQREVKLMIDPSAAQDVPADTAPVSFGAQDVRDLTWKQLMDAYSCTECGRCTSVCPANLTGKELSPRKIMMDTRDRLEEVGKEIDGKIEQKEGRTLLGDYISDEELWACTTCNACVEACPVNIDPLSIIIDLRRYLIMEKSSGPAELNNMFGNIENNGAPWPFSPADRLNWATDE